MSGPSNPFGGGWNKVRDFAEGGLPFGGHMPTNFGDFAKGGLPFGGHMPFSGGGGTNPTPMAGPMMTSQVMPNGNMTGSPDGTPLQQPPGNSATGTAFPLGQIAPPGFLTRQGGNFTGSPQWGNIGYPPGGGPNPVFGDMAADKAAGMNVSNGPIMHTPLFGSQDPNSPQASQGSVPLANSPTQNYSPVGSGAMPAGVSPDLITQALSKSGSNNGL